MNIKQRKTERMLWKENLNCILNARLVLELWIIQAWVLEWFSEGRIRHDLFTAYFHGNMILEGLTLMLEVWRMRLRGVYGVWVSEQFLNGTSAHNGYSVPWSYYSCKITSWHWIAYYMGCDPQTCFHMAAGWIFTKLTRYFGVITKLSRGQQEVGDSVGDKQLNKGMKGMVW